MASGLLLRVISDYLKQELVHYAAASDASGTPRSPEVYEWASPFPTGDGETPDFPVVVLRPRIGEDNAEGSTVTVDVLVWLYRNGEASSNEPLSQSGLGDVMALMEHLRIVLQRKRVLDGKYELVWPYKWELPVEQPLSHWEGRVETRWQVASILQQGEELNP